MECCYIRLPPETNSSGTLPRASQNCAQDRSSFLIFERGKDNRTFSAMGMARESSLNLTGKGDAVRSERKFELSDYLQ